MTFERNERPRRPYSPPGTDKDQDPNKERPSGYFKPDFNSEREGRPGGYNPDNNDRPFNSDREGGGGYNRGDRDGGGGGGYRPRDNGGYGGGGGYNRGDSDGGFNREGGGG